ncbi:c-type cytochrome [Paenibacillus puerhi]|uniref:c-type cytochrome n=1 Tax=Paenibacillus puerhi TaxID=2692622 RepID=UPI00135B1015|nr:cytochrome c [Paenibacillus puerhi]
MGKLAIMSILFSALIALSSACGGGGAGADKSGTAAGGTGGTGGAVSGGTAEAAGAEAVYKANCLACHGNNLQGASGPNLQKVGARLTKDQIVAKIQNGGGGMPAYKDKLKAEEIQALADWLVTHK